MCVEFRLAKRMCPVACSPKNNLSLKTENAEGRARRKRNDLLPAGHQRAPGKRHTRKARPPGGRQGPRAVWTGDTHQGQEWEHYGLA